MRALEIAVATLALVALAGCAVMGGVVSDGGTGPSNTTSEQAPPSDTTLAFAESAEEAGFDYASKDGTLVPDGNGNDGLYVGDYDGDLRQDVLAIGGEQPVLFENTGDGFEPSGALPNVTSELDPGAVRVQSALWLDHDADGSQDLLLLPRNGTPLLLENDGGSFEPVDAGIDRRFENPVGATTADYNGDGCLDVFVIQYGLWSDASPAGWHDNTWEMDNGNTNHLYRGSCGNGFTEAEDAGIGPSGRGPHWSLATSFVDLNDDGHPDIHVANDYYNDTIYYNQGDGTFEKVRMGAATDRNGMSSEVADLAGDDRPELFVTNIFFPRDRIDELPRLERRLFSNFLTNRLGKRLKGNTLLRANDTGWNDYGGDAGIAEGGWGWAAVMADLDSDGETDAVHSTQTIVTFDESDPIYEFPMVWVQQDGQFYRQDANEIGLQRHDGRGIAQVDYDVDGAVDVAIATYDDRYRLYENTAEQGNSLQVVVQGGEGTVGVGAEVYATVDGETQHYFVNARTDYQSQDSRVVHVGLGDAGAVEELRIVWPDGTERTIENVEAGQRIAVGPEGIEQRLEYDDGE